MTFATSPIAAIADQKPVRVFLPISGTSKRFRASAIFQKTGEATFKLFFKAGILPAESLDAQQSCYVTVDLGGATTSIEARLKQVINEQTLDMAVEKTISHEQMRKFFRVDATTSVISSAFLPEISGEGKPPWSLKGKTIDISGNGLLASFANKPPNSKQVQLQITLPTDEPEIITIVAHQVRCHQISDDLHEVAYHFDEIATEDRDKIIGWCLIIQRKLLRLKVKVHK